MSDEEKLTEAAQAIVAKGLKGPEALTKTVARVLRDALTIALKIGGEADQEFLTDLYEQLKPDLDWAIRYGVWPDFDDALPEDVEEF